MNDATDVNVSTQILPTVSLMSCMIRSSTKWLFAGAGGHCDPLGRLIHTAETTGDAQRIREKNSKLTESFGEPRTSRVYERRAKEQSDETDFGALQDQA